VYVVYDFYNEKGLNEIEAWLSGLASVLRARMEAKIDVLRRLEPDARFPPSMITDTKEPHIKEIRVNSHEALRLLLCKGPEPSGRNRVITLLMGAKERDSKYVPKKALEMAEERRRLVLARPHIHRRQRPDANP
jgi:hypothetical protein